MRTCRNKLHVYNETKHKQCPDCAKVSSHKFYIENMDKRKDENGKWKQGKTLKECQKRYRERHPDRIQKQKKKFKTDRPLYGIWKNMIRRCYQPSCDHFDRYGGRGIKVFDGWKGLDGYFRFEEYIGPRPSLIHSLDRYPNRDGNYEPGNVRWATPLEQAQNTSRARMITISGETKSISAWARSLKMNWRTFKLRMDRGLTGDDLLRPVDERYNRFKKFVAASLPDSA